MAAKKAAKTVDVVKARDEMISGFEEAQKPLKDNTSYFEAERRPDAVGLAVPQAMRKLLAHVGYPRLYINSIAERQELQGFRLGQADEADVELWDWWQANFLDVEATLGHTEALVHGRSYVTISMPDPAVDLYADPKVPIIRVEPPTRLYAKIDPKTLQVTQAIRAIYEDDKIVMATLYLPDQTVMWEKIDGGDWEAPVTVAHGLGVVPVVPIANRTRLSDLEGTSEITPELRSITDAAARILMDMQATAELMAIPQRLLFGVTPEELGVNPDTGEKIFDAYMARILAFEGAEGRAEQFNAAELRNFVDALDGLDKKAAAYTGLPPQYLSTNSDNPASAEAIKASESRLVKNCERKNKLFGGAWEQVMRVACLVARGGKLPPDYLRMEAIWADPSTPTYAAKADAASKLYAAGLGVIPKKRARQDMGYSITEITEMEAMDVAEAPALAAMIALTNPAPAGGSTNPDAKPKPTSTSTSTKTSSKATSASAKTPA